MHAGRKQRGSDEQEGELCFKLPAHRFAGMRETKISLPFYQDTSEKDGCMQAGSTGAQVSRKGNLVSDFQHIGLLACVLQELPPEQQCKLAYIINQAFSQPWQTAQHLILSFIPAHL